MYSTRKTLLLLREEVLLPQQGALLSHRDFFLTGNTLLSLLRLYCFSRSQILSEQKSKQIEGGISVHIPVKNGKHCFKRP